MGGNHDIDDLHGSDRAGAIPRERKSRPNSAAAGLERSFVLGERPPAAASSDVN